MHFCWFLSTKLPFLFFFLFLSFFLFFFSIPFTTFLYRSGIILLKPLGISHNMASFRWLQQFPAALNALLRKP